MGQVHLQTHALYFAHGGFFLSRATLLSCLHLKIGRISLQKRSIFPFCRYPIPQWGVEAGPECACSGCARGAVASGLAAALHSPQPCLAPCARLGLFPARCAEPGEAGWWLV